MKDEKNSNSKDNWQWGRKKKKETIYQCPCCPPSSQPIWGVCGVVPPQPTTGSSQLCLPPGVADGVSWRSFQPGFTYSCCTEKGRVDLTQLMDKFTHPHHLAVQLHPQRCKERQMWHLASCQDTSFFLKVRCTSLAALSPVLLSVTALLSALRMPFSNMGKEAGWYRGKTAIFSKSYQNGDLHFPPHLFLVRAALNPCRQFLVEVFFHQTGQIHLLGLTSHGCSHPATWRVSCCTIIWHRVQMPPPWHQS